MATIDLNTVECADLFSRLLESTAEVLKTDASSVDATVPLSEIGIDSLNVVEVIIACEEIYSDFTIDPAELEFNEMTTLLDMHNQMIAFACVA